MSKKLWLKAYEKAQEEYPEISEEELELLADEISQDLASVIYDLSS